MNIKANRQVVLFILLLSFICIIERMWLSVHTGFWCDELAWIDYTECGIKSLIANVQREPSHGPLDLVFFYYLAKLTSIFSTNVELAFRIFGILTAFLTQIWIIFSKKFINEEKILWSIWIFYSNAVLNYSINIRPYGPFIFYSSLYTMVFIDFVRSEYKESRFQIITLSVLSLTGLAFPYLLFLVLPLIIFTLIKSSLKNKKILFLLLMQVLLLFVWQKFFKGEQKFIPINNFELIKKIFSSETVIYIKEIFSQFINPILQTKIYLLILAVLIAATYKKNRTLYNFLILIVALSLSLPLVLDYKLNYFFTPRQALFGLASFAFLTIISICSIQNRIINFRVAVVIFFILGLYSRVHFYKNIPPYIDLPRYTFMDSFQKMINIGKKPIILSHCNLGSAYLFFNKELNRTQAHNYLYSKCENIKYDDSKYVLWTKNWASCSGDATEIPDPNVPLDHIQKNPEKYFIFAPYASKTPKPLSVVTDCITESGVPCKKE